MNKLLFKFILISLVFVNNALCKEFLDAYTLDKEKIEKSVMESVSDEKIKFKSIKNWPGSFENYKINKPGITFFSAKKLEVERNNNSKIFYKNCFFTMLPNLQPTLEIKGHLWKPGGHFLSQTNYTAEYNQTMNFGIQNWLKKGKKDSLITIKNLMLNWAENKSFSHLYPDTGSKQGGMNWGYVDTFWNLRDTITNIIIAYGVLSELNIFSSEEKKIVHDWLEFLVAASASQGHDDGSGDGMAAGIHTEMQRTLVYTLWGSVSGNDKYFQAGIKGFYAALVNTRKDGSHKYEVRNVKDASKRNQRALKKMNQVVGAMVMIAEIVKLQGYDLYEIKTKKKVDLHKMIEFLSNGWSDKNIKLRHLVSKNQDIGFAYKFSGSMASIAWVIPYLSNNFDTNGNKLIVDWLKSLPSDRKKFVNDFGFGGSQACYYANKVNISF